MCDDDDDVMPYETPLDLGLAFDERDPNDLDDEDGHQCPQDAAGDGFDLEDDGEERDSLGHPKQAWHVILAERDDAGEWRTIGEPLPDAQFDEMGMAHAWAENRNRRDFGKRFDWANDPDRGWIAVRAEQARTARMHEP